MATVGRFAPSPSGRMHLGNVLAALLAWLSVRSAGGTMLLRIEDLDPARCREDYALQLKDDLHWLGLDWDEEQTPQSQRTAAYEEKFRLLEARGLVYPCYCSRDALRAASAPHERDGESVYPGTCRNLTDAERARQTKKPSWRIRVPDEIFTVEDGVQGVYRANLARDCGDFVVRRADGVYAYQLAVVTDDIAGGVTQVVRGRDLLSSSPRQQYLLRLFGADAPDYFHVPLLVDQSGRRLSKRDGDLDLGALRQTMTPKAIIGMLAFAVGLTGNSAPISARELATVFSWDKVQKQDIVIRDYLKV